MVVTLVVLASLADGPPLLAQDAGAERLTGQVVAHEVRRGDTLSSLGARYGVDNRTLAADNGKSTTDVLVVGRALRIDNRHITPTGHDASALIVNIPQRMLFHRGDLVTAFPVALGRPSWRTPTGDFMVATREENPTWDVPSSILAAARRAGRPHPTRVPPGPRNPLGAFWLGLSAAGIGVHGTIEPASIYRFASHGCIRLHPDDIAWLFPRVNVGDAVALIYESVLLAQARGHVFLEVHPDAYGLKAPTLARVRELAAAQGVTEQIDWAAATRVVGARQGVARDVTRARNDED
jgi:L,D-transpeptidase ErfK/SrfK